MVPLRAAALTAAAFMTAMFVYVVALRVAFPYELEWMCGSMVDHVDRVRQGMPVYTAPATSWMPFLYPPLFYWVAAPLGGSFLACRMVSIAATVVQAWCTWRIARRCGARAFWAILGTLSFFASYFYVGCWYDVERSDMLCTALVSCAALLVVEPPRVAASRRAEAARAALAGAVFGIAFFAKQQALPFAVACIVALAIGRHWRRASALAAGCALVVVLGVVWQNKVTGGWFAYYVLKMPASHGLDGSLWHDLTVYDVPRGLGLIALTVGVCSLLVFDLWKGEWHAVWFGLMLGTGGVVALSSRLHVGGWINVLLPWVAFACPAIGVAGTRIERWAGARAPRRRALAAFYLGVLAQLFIWFHPKEYPVPDAMLRRDTEEFHAEIRRLEAQGGEVLVVGRGHLTEKTHFQMSGLADVARTSGVPSDLINALRTQRLTSIVDDARLADSPPLGLWPPVMLEDVPGAKEALFANYFVSERFDPRIVRLAMPAPAMPSWVYRPRRRPVAENAHDVLTRHFAEMALAAARADAARGGHPLNYSNEDIEELAAREAAAAP